MNTPAGSHAALAAQVNNLTLPGVRVFCPWTMAEECLRRPHLGGLAGPLVCALMSTGYTLDIRMLQRFRLPLERIREFVYHSSYK